MAYNVVAVHGDVISCAYILNKVFSRNQKTQFPIRETEFFIAISTSDEFLFSLKMYCFYDIIITKLQDIDFAKKGDALCRFFL